MVPPFERVGLSSTTAVKKDFSYNAGLSGYLKKLSHVCRLLRYKIKNSCAKIWYDQKIIAIFAEQKK